ncbi:hypothetical protein ABPG72_008176 [Tetrahymena utriculariae]
MNQPIQNNGILNNGSASQSQSSPQIVDLLRQIGVLIQSDPSQANLFDRFITLYQNPVPSAENQQVDEQPNQPAQINNESSNSQELEKADTEQSDDEQSDNDISQQNNSENVLQQQPIHQKQKINSNHIQSSSSSQKPQILDNQKDNILKKIKKYQEISKTSNKHMREKIIDMQNFKAYNEVQCQMHVQQQIKKGKLKCPGCSSTLCNKYSLNRHIVNKHKVLALSLGISKFYCDLCSQTMYKTIEKYEKHAKLCLQDYVKYNIAAKNINQSDLDGEEPELTEQELLEYEEACNMNI